VEFNEVFHTVLYNFINILEVRAVNRIRELREKAGMKQATLASKLHVGPTSISNYEVGARMPPTETVIELCDIFGVSADYLLGRSDSPTGAVSDQEAALLTAFHAAPLTVQTAISVLLSPYMGAEKKTGAAV
jgi:transcriptional regulator with XRE-family HTH domain